MSQDENQQVQRISFIPALLISAALWIPILWVIFRLAE